MKTRIFTSMIVALILSTNAMASHELGGKTEELSKSDGHISWHEFRHELASYSTITASISNGGLVTLRGDADDGVTRSKIEQIARKIRGATEIHNYITTH